MDGLMRTQPGYFAMGLRRTESGSVIWLACVRAKSPMCFIQMNHNGFARYSLSTVLRSYFFEHEIGRGQEEINFVNGTCCPLSTLLRNGYLCDGVGAPRPHGVRYLPLDCPLAQCPGSRIKYATLDHEAGTNESPGRSRFNVKPSSTKRLRFPSTPYAMTVQCSFS
jgi:hypothetical protein